MGSPVRRVWRLTAVLLLFTSCSSLGSGVRMTRRSKDVEPCRSLGEIRSKEGVADLKRKARALGANTLLLVLESAPGGGSSETVGIAYRCP